METEYAAMSIISAARTINLNADALPTMFDQASSQADLLAMLHEGNLILSTNITEILGQLQFQDVVRQRVARAVIAIGQRNVVFKELMQDIELNELTLLPLAQDMRNALEQYVQNEKLHAAALNNGVDQDAALPKIEFF
jgi:methyl-accepting chemotaxis protein